MKLELSGITKHYDGRKALEDINLIMPSNTSLAVFGPNGAGKSTLLKIISGAMSQTRGNITYNGGTESNGDIRKEVFFLGHKNSLYNALTVSENIHYVRRLYGRRNGGDTVDEFLRLHGLWSRRNDPVSELSQGMKRRLSLAKAFYINPRLFIFDEPFSGLDIRSRSFLLGEMSKIKEHGKSLIMSTHIIEAGHEIADLIAFIQKGRLIWLREKGAVSIQEIYDAFHSTGKSV